ncbi:MAG: alpha/beta hydrolase family protein [Candidatus Saccharibacteria bacterium]
MTKISVTSQGSTLAGNLFFASQPKPLAFLFIQGWQGHQNVVAAQNLANLGFSSMTYDMHGNGESEGDLGDFSRAEFLDDAANMYDYFKQQLPQGTKIGVIGSSFGSYTGVLLAAERAVHCLSLRVPATYPDDGFAKPQLPQINAAGLVEWRKKPLDHHQNKAFQVLHDFGGEVLIIESSEDTVVPQQACQNYANAVADPTKLQYHVMHGAPHSLINDEQHREYGRILTDWATAFNV